MCHGMPHTVVNVLRHVLPGIAISMSWLICKVTGNRKPDQRGGGGVICVSHGFRVVYIYPELLFFYPVRAWRPLIPLQHWWVVLR